MTLSEQNKKIKNATTCKSGSITFKSKLEKTCYDTLDQLGFNPQYEPKSFELWKSFEPITPFYDQETKKHQVKRLEKKEYLNIKSKMLIPKTGKVIGIRYTPDIYFRYQNLDVYIEIKGKENDVFYIKKKLFRKYLDDLWLNTSQPSIYFEVYTKKQLLQAIDIIKEYAEKIK